METCDKEGGFVKLADFGITREHVIMINTIEELKKLTDDILEGDTNMVGLTDSAGFGVCAEFSAG